MAILAFLCLKRCGVINKISITYAERPSRLDRCRYRSGATSRGGAAAGRGGGVAGAASRLVEISSN